MTNRTYNASKTKNYISRNNKFKATKKSTAVAPINLVFLEGVIESDLELKTSVNDHEYCSIHLKTVDKWTDDEGEKRETVDFHTVMAWGEKALDACKRYAKGKRIKVKGKVRSSSYERDGETRNFISIHPLAIKLA